MPNWSGVRVSARCVALAVGVAFGALGCNATCIRDSDCLGQSVCSENRCLLIAGRDAGRSSTPSDEPSEGGNGGSAGSDDGAGGTDTIPPSSDAGE